MRARGRKGCLLNPLPSAEPIGRCRREGVEAPPAPRCRADSFTDVSRVSFYSYPVTLQVFHAQLPFFGHVFNTFNILKCVGRSGMSIKQLPGARAKRGSRLAVVDGYIQDFKETE